MQTHAPKIVFFGIDSLFSGILLQALVRSELKPLLVVDGIEHPQHRRSAIFRNYPCQIHGLTKIGRSLGLNRAHKPTDKSTSDANLVELAHAANIDALVVSDVDALRFRAKIQSLQPDFFVVAGFPSLLSSNVLALAGREGLNVHPGKLPSQRGPAPLFWALKSGASHIAYTVHILDDGEDTGDIVGEGDFELQPGLHGRDIHKQCALAASPHLVRSARALWAGDLVRTKQSRIGVARCPRPEYRDNLLDPTISAEQVYSFVCACIDAYPIFAECGGDRFFIKAAHGYSMDDDLPCEFMLSGDELLLRCQPGVVRLSLKPNGGAVFSSEYREKPQAS